MAQPGGEHVYATLLLSDSYLPGALVLAHSLRDAGSRTKLAVLITVDTLSAGAITQLQTVYDYILPVPRLHNDHPANLYLMNRADLHSAFTKVNLWKLTQFSKIVYIDADVVAYRAPEELFNLPHAFSAAPDIGWPDIFNSGVMVLTPNMGDYYALLAMAERGISFDGADQGLLNMHFKNSFNRLSFAYNVTPSGHYQYIPAYRHFQSSISMVHFIGSNKPWFAGRNAPFGNSPFDEMVGRWWAVYDRHYRIQEPAPYPAQDQRPHQVQHQSTEPQTTGHTKQIQNVSGHEYRRDASSSDETPSYHPQQMQHQSIPPSSSITQVEAAPATAPEQQAPEPTPGAALPRKQEPDVPPISMNNWDAQIQPPPADSKPEAMNFPSAHYEMSRDATPFKPPVRYPSPPKNMWYEVPKEPPSPRRAKPRAIFPWEENRPTPSRTFANEDVESPTLDAVAGDTLGERRASTGKAAPIDPNVTDRSTEDAADASKNSETSTPTISITSSDPWSSFMRSNAWDEVPEINRYVDGLQKHRRGTSLTSLGVATPGAVLSPGIVNPAVAKKDKPRAFKLTDFPSEVERPSLPVTPAPIRRESLWGDDSGLDADERAMSHLPTAEGVPSQAEWDPAEQLQKLAKLQSEMLLRKFGGDNEDNDDSGDGGGAGRAIPSRALPFGSETFTSPTYVAQTAPGVLSPRPVKGEAAAAGLVRKMSEGDDVPSGQGNGTAATSTTTAEPAAASGVAEQDFAEGEATEPRGSTTEPEPSE